MKLFTGITLIAALGELAADPSSKPCADPTGKTKYAERFRIIVDLDADGEMDMLLSGLPDEFGTMGGPWSVHLNRGDDYKEVGELWAHPKAITFESDPDRIHADPATHRFARVWVYLKSSGSAGSFGYFRVGKDTVDELESVEIQPGDGGTDLGRAIYDAAFHESQIPFKIQRSSTTEDGTLTWNEVKR